MQGLGSFLLLNTFAAIALIASTSPKSLGPQIPKFCSGCNFSGAKLPGSNFDNGTYIGVNFAGADLHRSSFRAARLLAANFENANLQGVAFDGAQCTACNFSGTQLSGSTFLKVIVVAANFKDFAAKVADDQLRSLLSGCVSCDFSGANLAGRNLSGATLLSVDLSRADLRGTRFDGAVVCWKTVQESQSETHCDPMAGARTAGTIFTGVVLCDDPVDRAGCNPVSAKTLTEKVGSPLQGAVLP